MSTASKRIRRFLKANGNEYIALRDRKHELLASDIQELLEEKAYWKDRAERAEAKLQEAEKELLQKDLTIAVLKIEPQAAANRGLKQYLERLREGGTGEIIKAREYQKRRHPASNHLPELLHTAALALLLDSEVLYPRQWNATGGFAKMRNRGRKVQLAHAGACIAALIDRLPLQAGDIAFAPEN